MSGTKMGSLKRKLGLQGHVKSGDMLKRMNEMKGGAASGVGRLEKAMKCKTCGMNYKSHAGMHHKFDPMGMVKNIGNSIGGAIKTGEQGIGKVTNLVGRLGGAFVRNVTGGDIGGIVKNKKKKGVKTTGTSYGKSNRLGHGGRAAQLKHAGVPGGVIGNLARRAHAAPGEKNYHGKKS